MRRAAAAILAFLAINGSLPAAGQSSAASTPTTLYFHLFDTFSPFPVNTQPPDISFFEVGGTSFPSIVSQGFQFNRVRGFATPGPVEYGFIESGRPRFHLEPGIAGEVELDRAAGARAVFYVDVRDLLGVNVLPSSLPSLTFHVDVREGNQLGTDEVTDAGQLLLSGRATKWILDASGCVPSSDDLVGGLPASTPEACDRTGNSQLTNQTTPAGDVVIPDAAGIAAVVVPLAIASDTIPKTAYNVRVDWWQNPTGQEAADNQLATGLLRLVSDATHHPRMELAVRNPVSVHFLHPQVAAGILLIHSGVNSPWGTYDVDVANMTVEVTGPAQPQKLQQVVSQGAHVHDLHDRPAEVTWLWRFRDEQAPVGEYLIRLTVPNLAGTARAVEEARFNIEETRAYGIDEEGNEVTPSMAPPAQESPSAGILLVLGVLALAAFARRRST